MPRNSQGLYTLPAGNPVVPNTLIEAPWANITMDDIAAALTGSLPRDGSAPMTAPLTLTAAAPTQPRHAVSKAYMEQFLAYATGMPIGAVFAVAGSVIPPGTIECNGQALSRTTYADLFATIGTIYGAGDGSTTFNVPDLRDYFIRGKADARTVGSVQAASLASHLHPLVDPGHTHGAAQAAHSHAVGTNAHTHTVNDPGHLHYQAQGLTAGSYSNSGNGGSFAESSSVPTGSSVTGISLNAAGDLGGSTDTKQPAVTVDSATTGITSGAEGGAETVPQNYAMIYVIKSINDTTSNSFVTSVTTSDANMISVDATNPVVPELVIHSNVAFGTVKLDASGKVPILQMPTSSSQFLGYFDASPGTLPAGPATSGDYYAVSVQGTLTVYDPVTLTASPTLVPVGSQLHYVTGSLTNPTGWYTLAVSGATLASDVQFIPAGNVTATNVQAAIVEVDANKVDRSGDTMTGDLTITTGRLFLENAIESELALAGGIGDGYLYCNAMTMGWNSYSSPLSPWSVELSNGKATFNAVLVGGAQDTAINALTRKDYVDSALALKATTAQLDAATKGPAFAAQGSLISPAVNVSTKAPITTEVFDTNGNYDAANSRFTPTVAGYYQVNADGGNRVALATFGIYISIMKNNATVFGQGGSTGNDVTFARGQASALVYMNGTTDYLEVYLTATGPSGNAQCICDNFSAFLARPA